MITFQGYGYLKYFLNLIDTLFIASFIYSGPIVIIMDMDCNKFLLCLIMIPVLMRTAVFAFYEFKLFLIILIVSLFVLYILRVKNYTMKINIIGFRNKATNECYRIFDKMVRKLPRDSNGKIAKIVLKIVPVPLLYARRSGTASPRPCRSSWC